MGIEDADPIDRQVGARVRALRIRNGVTQADLARAVGVSFQQVQKYESGANRISASMLVHIARALDIPVHGLFPEPDTPQIVDLMSYTEGPVLAGSLAAMTPARRALLVEIARVFAEEGAGAGEPSSRPSSWPRTRSPRRARVSA